MVTCPLWCSRAARSISMRALGDTRTPSVSTTSPSTFTQPLVIQRSASRREHRPSSPIRLERRGCSGFSGAVGERFMQQNVGRHVQFVLADVYGIGDVDGS